MLDALELAWLREIWHMPDTTPAIRSGIMHWIAAGLKRTY